MRPVPNPCAGNLFVFWLCEFLLRLIHSRLHIIYGDPLIWCSDNATDSASVPYLSNIGPVLPNVRYVGRTGHRIVHAVPPRSPTRQKGNGRQKYHNPGFLAKLLS